MKANSWLLHIYFFIEFATIFSKEYFCTQENELFKKFRQGVNELENIFFVSVSEELTSKLKNSEKQSLSFIVSPLWLEFLLIGISIGSKGKTLEELNNITCMNQNLKLLDKAIMLHCIQQSIPSDNHMKIEINNMMIIPKEIAIKKIYEVLITAFGKISLQTIDVNVSSPSVHLNNMIKKKTKRRMKDIFDESDLQGNDTSLVIVSSIYFKNKWLYSPTVLNNTIDFKTNNGRETEKIKMFRITGLMPFADIKKWNAKIVDIPYVTENISMLIFLPNKVDGLLEMEKSIMKQNNIIKFTNKILKKTPISITLPAYTLESTIILPSKLKMMGFHYLFEKNLQMNLAFRHNVHITNIVQRLKLWANEGRGAFKDTGDEEFPVPQKILIADHPFFFILKMNHTSFMMGHFTK